MSRYDSEGEPLIWPYLDGYETENEKFGRCPDCVKSDKRMPVGEVNPKIDNMISTYQKEKPGTSRELAFAKVQELLNEALE